jgi:hypothetical protein
VARTADVRRCDGVRPRRLGAWDRPVPSGVAGSLRRRVTLDGVPKYRRRERVSSSAEGISEVLAALEAASTTTYTNDIAVSLIHKAEQLAPWPTRLRPRP